MLNDTELLTLLRDLESDRVERKASLSDMKKIRRAVCAFANDLPGHAKPGVIFVGVHDDGSCATLSIDDALLTKLAQVRSNGDILPIPSIQVSKHTLDGCEVAVLQVDPASAPPVRFSGRIWIRVGPTTQEAGDDDERVLRERLRHAHQPFDRRPAQGSTLDDLDISFFEQAYLPQALDADVLQKNNRTREERLASLRFLVNGTPTYGALIVLGKEPRDFVAGAYIQFLRIDGTDLGDPIKDQKELSGPLYQQLSQIDALVDINISTALDLTAAPRHQLFPDYPVSALQQILRNAVIHRNYETSHAPVRLYWFRDRIEIHSPGGLYGQVTPETFGKGVTDYRNPLVAEAMAHLGYVQRFGYGIPTAKRELASNGNPEPVFELQPNYILVTVRPRL
ncbi:MAG: putative DNA binding domain-containing protein [Deltaproteobacteria bacterium]|nr:putative DNA binding domain-containing protein [Deltaproteobacteria bacterium]